MALLPQNPRDQKLFIMGLLAVGLVGVYQQLYWSPKNQEQTILAARLDTLDSLNLLAKAEVAKGNSAKMKAEGDAFSRELGVLRHLVPTSNEVPALLESISNAARRAGLEISEVAPDGVMNGDRLDTYKYKLGVTGPYHQIAEFLSNVASLPRIVAPINLTLGPTGRTVFERRPKRGEVYLDAKFGVQTYVEHVAGSGSSQGGPAMKRTLMALGAVIVAASVASAQNPAAAIEKARNAKAASDKQTEAMQHPEDAAPKQGSPKAVPKQATPAPRPKGGAPAKPNALDVAKPDTMSPPPTIYREMFTYSADGRRDPFVSLLTTNDLRPTMSDLRLTGVLFDHSGRGNSLATLRDVTTNAQYRVGVGSTLGRMRVSAIRTETVVFTIEEFGTTRRDSLVLRDSTNKARGK